MKKKSKKKGIWCLIRLLILIKIETDNNNNNYSITDVVVINTEQINNNVTITPIEDNLPTYENAIKNRV